MQEHALNDFVASYLGFADVRLSTLRALSRYAVVRLSSIVQAALPHLIVLSQNCFLGPLRDLSRIAISSNGSGERRALQPTRLTAAPATLHSPASTCS